LFTWQDVFAGVQIFFLVFLCTLPVSLPFVFIHDAGLALRVSNGIGLLLLFIGGYKLSSYSGFKPILGALLYTFVGVILVFVTMVLGG
jgi:VIT1/CCC1 family predicted Fe2+/Mn2+ transporter